MVRLKRYFYIYLKGGEINMSMNNKDYFFCYNVRLSKFLQLKGINYITKAKHCKTDQVFSLFLINDELNNAIQQYKEVFKHEN